MDNFGGAAAWDRYCALQDELLEYYMENTTCGKCMKYEDGTCLYSGEKVDPDTYAIELECEEVEPR